MDYSDPTKFMDVRQYMRPKEQLVAMGFPEGAAEATLAAHGGDFEAAANALAASAPAAAPAAASLAAPPAPPPPDVDTKAPRPRNVLMAEFEGLSKADASQALRDAGGDLDRARAAEARKRSRSAAEDGGPPAKRARAASPAPAAPTGRQKRAATPADHAPPQKRARSASPAPAAPRPVNAATSAYQLALRDAVKSALAAVAADNKPLFVGAARAALERVAALDEDSRHVLARLLFVKGPWHPVQGSRASVESYAGGDAAAAMAALTRAGALVPLTDESPLADAAEALPALVGDEVKRVYMALKESAPDAWKAAKKQHKGSTKEVHVAVIRAVAAGLEDAKALSFLIADERALARVDRDTETALLRALRFSEQRVGLLSRPAPPTRRLMAVLTPPHLRSAEAPPSNGTPLFRTRRHFERTEGVAGLAHAAGIAAAIANGDAWGDDAVELLVVYCVEINQCVGCIRQFFTKSFLGDDAADLARSSGEEPASPRH
jgi:hypothetical protein